MTERTLVIIKPDGVQRHLAGEIIGRFERKGFKLVAAKFMWVSEELSRELYSVHQGKAFYEGLVRYIASGPVLLTVWEADGVISMVRGLMGATFGYEAAPGTIRGDMGCSKGCNLVHGSDSVESAKREIGLFFEPGELVDYELCDAKWLYGENE